jgi:hypothetical protein
VTSATRPLRSKLGNCTSVAAIERPYRAGAVE